MQAGSIYRSCARTQAEIGVVLLERGDFHRGVKPWPGEVWQKCRLGLSLPGIWKCHIKGGWPGDGRSRNNTPVTIPGRWCRRDLYLDPAPARKQKSESSYWSEAISTGGWSLGQAKFDKNVGWVYRSLRHNCLFTTVCLPLHMYKHICDNLIINMI